MAISTVAGPYPRVQSEASEPNVAKTSGKLVVYPSSTSSSESNQKGTTDKIPSVGEGSVAEITKWALVVLYPISRCLYFKW